MDTLKTANLIATLVNQAHGYHDESDLHEAKAAANPGSREMHLRYSEYCLGKATGVMNAVKALAKAYHAATGYHVPTDRQSLAILIHDLTADKL